MKISVCGKRGYLAGGHFQIIAIPTLLISSSSSSLPGSPIGIQNPTILFSLPEALLPFQLQPCLFAQTCLSQVGGLGRQYPVLL